MESKWHLVHSLVVNEFCRQLLQRAQPQFRIIGGRREGFCKQIEEEIDFGCLLKAGFDFGSK